MKGHLHCGSEISMNLLCPQVKEGYFKGLVAAGRVTEEGLGEHIFASKPAAGGAILNLQL